MGKRIGKAIFWCLFFQSVYALDKQIYISIQDTSRHNIKQVEVGVPFVVQVIAENFETATAPQDIAGLKKDLIVFHGTMNSTSWINGVQTKKIIHTFSATAHQKGPLKIGPVVIRDENGNAIESNVVTIEVGDSIEHSQAGAHQSFLLQLSVDQKSVYIGQKIRANLRFCYKEKFQNLVIAKPTLHDMYQGDVFQEAEKGSCKIGEQEYQYEKYLMNFYPEKTGLVVIPVYQASLIPENQSSFGFGGLIGMFGMNAQKVIQSNACSIEVKALPHIKGFENITAIGNFDSINFELQQVKGSVGEGMIATMTISGDGNFEIMKAPELKLPEGLHCYEGNSSINHDKDFMKATKTFEWIIQADKPASFVISEQNFSYFDPYEKVYKTLKTAPLKLQVTGTAIVKSEPAYEVAPQKKSEKQKYKHQFKEDELNYINESNENLLKHTTATVWYHKLISWLLFFLIILLCLIAAYLFFTVYAQAWVAKSLWWHQVQWKYLFFMCHRRKDILGLYRLFEQIAAQYKISLHREQMKDCFDKLQLPQDTFVMWQQFTEKLLAMNFSRHLTSEQEVHEIFVQGKKWLAVVVLCCKLQKNSYSDTSVIS